MELMGPDGHKYVIPPHQKDDWDSWVLLHEADGMPKWTPPPYARRYSIDSFTGDYHFLSNFHNSPMNLDLGPLGKWSVDNVEQVYQAAKAVDNQEAINVIRSNTPGRAKRLGRTIKKRDDWDDIKVDVMRQYVTEKFKQNPDLAAKLVATGDAILIEGNTWGDRFWGTVGGVGENWLGKILMEVRDGLSNSSTN